MRARRLLLLCGVVSMLASCQTTRTVFAPRPYQSVLAVENDTTTTVVLLHDSQGPQATRVVLTSAEAATFSFTQQ